MNRQTQEQQQPRVPGSACRVRIWLILAGPFILLFALIAAGLIWRIKAPGSRLQNLVTAIESTNAVTLQSPPTNPPAAAK